MSSEKRFVWEWHQLDGRIEHFNHHPPTEHWFWQSLRVEPSFVGVWVQQRNSNTFLEQKILRTDTLKREIEHFTLSALLFPWGSKVGARRDPVTDNFSQRGKWGHGSECPVSPTWETVSKRPRSFSPNPDYWCSLQSERTGRGWNIAARAEVIKETLLNTSLVFLLTISWTLSGILLMSLWGASSMNPSWPTVIPNTPNSSLTLFTLSVHPWPERASLCRQLMSKCRKRP